MALPWHAGCNRSGVVRTFRFAVALALVWQARPVLALTHEEVTCQEAIGRAGRAFVTAELASGARCRMAAMIGQDCDPSLASERHTLKLRRTLDRCFHLSLAHLVPGGCAETSTSLAALADCLITGHEQMVESLLTAEFGDPP